MGLQGFMKGGVRIQRAVASFAAEMSARYPFVVATSPIQTVVEYQWRITYQTGDQALASFLVSLSGFHWMLNSKLKFKTYHILNADELHAVQLIRGIKLIAYPVFVLLMILAVLIMAGTAFLVGMEGRTASDAVLIKHLKIAGWAAGSLLILFIMTLSLKRCGRPPGTGKDFKSPLIILESVKALKTEV